MALLVISTSKIKERPSQHEEKSLSHGDAWTFFPLASAKHRGGNGSSTVCQGAFVTLTIPAAGGIIDWATENIIDRGNDQSNWSSQIVLQSSKYVPV